MAAAHNETKKTEKIVVWFSCGAASAVAAIKAFEIYGSTHEIIIANNPIAEEDTDNIRFKKDIAHFLSVDITEVKNRNYPQASANEIWKKGFMSGPRGAPCTSKLKIEARRQWQEEHKPDYHILGFTMDEESRSDDFIERANDINVIPILIDLKITKADCYQIIQELGIELPRVYKMGYPNANCIGCVKATSPTYWNHVRNCHPDVFEERSALSRQIGCRLVRVNGKRIFLDELDPTAEGAPLKNMDFECGIFCQGN